MKSINDRQSYSREKFVGLTFSGPKLSYCEFDGCSFDRCVLVESILSHCRFTDCRFTACDMSLIRVPNCRFINTQFSESKFVGVDWTVVASGKTERLLFSGRFDGCVLDYGSFFGLALEQVRNCSARDVDFSESSLVDADCRGTTFAGAKFLHTDLSGADFVGAKEYAIDATANKVKKAKFSYPDVMCLLSGLDIVVEY